MLVARDLNLSHLLTSKSHFLFGVHDKDMKSIFWSAKNSPLQSKPRPPFHHETSRDCACLLMRASSRNSIWLVKIVVHKSMVSLHSCIGRASSLHFGMTNCSHKLNKQSALKKAPFVSPYAKLLAAPLAPVCPCVARRSYHKHKTCAALLRLARYQL